MESSMNMNRLRAHRLDEDDNLSANSYGFYNSTFNSDSECGGSVSVRDMIKLYNNQLQKDQNQIKHKNAVSRQSEHLLETTKSYCGLNKYASHSNIKQWVDQNHSHTLNCCKNGTACCQNRSRTKSITNTMVSSSFLLQNTNENNNCNQINAKDILVVDNMNPSTTSNKTPIIIAGSAEFKDDLNKKHSSHVAVQENHHQRLLSTDSVEEANTCQPHETSYQSKTTIAKTSSGVRIIIDIFFNEEQCVNATDAVGSRVETDIPQSRILNEFQKQSMTSNVIDASNVMGTTSAALNKN